MLGRAENGIKRKLPLCYLYKNKNCEDLEKGKSYLMLPNEEAEKEGYVKVID